MVVICAKRLLTGWFKTSARYSFLVYEHTSTSYYILIPTIIIHNEQRARHDLYTIIPILQYTPSVRKHKHMCSVYTPMEYKVGQKFVFWKKVVSKYLCADVKTEFPYPHQQKMVLYNIIQIMVFLCFVLGK